MTISNFTPAQLFAQRCDPFEPESATTTGTCAVWRETVAIGFELELALHQAELAIAQLALLKLGQQLAVARAETAAILEKAVIIADDEYELDKDTPLDEGSREFRKKYGTVEVTNAIRMLIPTDYAAALAEHDKQTVGLAEQALYLELESAVRNHLKNHLDLGGDPFFALQSAFTLCRRGSSALAERERKATEDTIKKD